MSQHRATITWQKGDAVFDYDSYSRNHQWSFDNGLLIEASAAVPYLGDNGKIDPEEAFVASISSCHMLTFLAICARKRILVESYKDEAVGFLEKNDDGSLAVTRVELRPAIDFADEMPDSGKLKALHDMAHHQCFIASSVKTEVVTIVD